jgi:predicted dinucleotide-binding enzyme
MEIGILGVGNIGATLTKRLSVAGHYVKVANSRGPETIPAEVFGSGGRAVQARDVVSDVDALIVSIPFHRVPGVRPLVDDLPVDAVVLDTCNYYPLRDSGIEGFHDPQVESLWVAEQLGRPVVKAWNAITADSFSTKATSAGSPGRIAIPVSADREADRAVGLSLVEETGFDAFYAGTLAESWRHQPGSPCYCTDLTREEMPGALAAAIASRSPKRRDLAMTVIYELMEDTKVFPGADFLVPLNRLLYR